MTAKCLLRRVCGVVYPPVEPESFSQVSEKLVLNSLYKVTMCTRAIYIVFFNFAFYLLHTKMAMHTGHITIMFPRPNCLVPEIMISPHFAFDAYFRPS